MQLIASQKQMQSICMRARAHAHACVCVCVCVSVRPFVRCNTRAISAALYVSLKKNKKRFRTPNSSQNNTFPIVYKVLRCDNEKKVTFLFFFCTI